MREESRAVRERRFWGRYIEVLNKQGIKPPFDKWHVRRAEAFIRAFPNRRLADLGPEDVSGYLTQMGRQGAMKPWQFRQVVDAIRSLYSIVSTEWAGGFDWGFWHDSARALGPQHETTARERAPVTPTEFVERLGDTRFAPLVRAHLELFASIATVIRTRNMAFRTEQAYMGWVCRFMLHFGGKSPVSLGSEEVASFLQHLAVQRNVAASTQNQALNALVFLYKHVLKTPLGDIEEFARAKRPKRVPVVLSAGEMRRLLAELRGVQGMIASLLYGTGMRLMEGLRMRVQDVEFERKLIVIRRGKGDKDRVVPLPDILVPSIKAHLVEVKALHEKDLAAGLGEVGYSPMRLQ